MKFYQETTVYDSPVPAHIYALNDSQSKLYAYVKAGTHELITFAKPLNFDSRKRKFVEVPDVYGAAEPEDQPLRWEVTGTKGNKYIVEDVQGMLQCSCPGFRFKGQCRHVTEIMENL
jgi:hypothetical protein